MLFVTAGSVSAQSNQEVIQQLGSLVDDALLYSDKYVTPVVDAAVYQSVAGWVATPKKRELFDVELSVHANIFFVPKRDRRFTLSNSDLTFFQFEEGTAASVPTGFGNDDQYMLQGQLGDGEVNILTPEGIDMEQVAYPYIQAAVGLWYGTDIIVKYSPKVNFRKREFQTYGAGIKHNISQYFGSLEEKDIHFSVLAAYSKENMSSNFLDVETDYGSLGISRIDGIVDTWQFQLNGSKEYGNFEFMGGIIVNTSDIKYEVGGEKGSIEEILPLQDVLNMRLREIYKTRVNTIGEAAATYRFNKFSVQAILAFGKFVNTNISLHYSI